MLFSRVDDDVVVGIGATLFFRKGQTVDTDSPEFAAECAAAAISPLSLIELFMAGDGWREGGPAEMGWDEAPPTEPDPDVALATEPATE